jgi:glutamyl-tRNA reductase
VKLVALGVDYRSAPAEVREALAFEGPEGLEALARAFPGNELVVLSTCNRVEIYAAGEAQDVPGLTAMTEFLAGFHGLPEEAFSKHLVGYHDEGALGHLFRVAASLESLVLGEGQILGQVREAFRAAQRQGKVGPILHKVFENALRVGKKVREDTGMDQGKLSVASVAVDVAKSLFDTFSDKSVLVIGAGKMGDLTAKHLTTLRPGKLLVTNRSLERALAAAEKWGGEALPFERLNLALIEADVVVSTTAAGTPLVGYEQYVRVQRARRNRLALILDIAIPRDFDPAIGALDQVMLYNVDDLQAQAEENRRRRHKGIDPAVAIIERETAACFAALRQQRHAGAVLQALGDHADRIRQRELDALYAACPELTADQRAAIAHMVQRLQNQLLHHPRAAVRSAAAEPDADHPHPLLNAVRHLFGLGDQTSTRPL